MVSASARSLLVGRDEQWTKRWAIAAVALFFASLGYFALVKELGYPAFHLALGVEGYVVPLVMLIAVQANSNDGLVLSWALAFAAISGAILNYMGIGLTSAPPELPELLGLAVAGGLIGAAVLGTLGFAIGATTRRIVL